MPGFVSALRDQPEQGDLPLPTGRKTVTLCGPGQP